MFLLEDVLVTSRRMFCLPLLLSASLSLTFVREEDLVSFCKKKNEIITVKFLLSSHVSVCCLG